MKALFISIYNFFEHRKVALWGILISLFGVFALMAINISFEEDISKILNLDNQTKKYNKVIQSSKLVDKLVFIVSYKDSTVVNQDKLTSFTDSLGSLLIKNSEGLIKKLTLKIEEDNFQSFYSIFLQNLPVFLEESDYQNLDSLFTEANLKKELNRNLQALSTPLGVISRYNLIYDPAGIGNNYLKRLRTFQTASSLKPFNGYLFSNDNKHLVFYLEPANPSNETGKNGKMLDIIDNQISILSQQKEFKGIDCKYFGSTAISVGNARQLQFDTILTLTISGIALFLLLFLVFKKRRIPLLILLTVTFGGGFALAAVSFIKTSISLIAIGAGSVILGIAVNYPIHLLSHKLHESNIRNVIRDMVVPLTIGSATTIGGFLCLLFMKTELLQDLGLFGAFSLIGAALFTLIFFPHMLGKDTDDKTVVRNWLEKIGNISVEKKKLPLLIILLLTPILLYFAPKVKFESDLTKLNFISKDLQKTEALLTEINGGIQYTIHAISYGKTQEEAFANSYGIKEITDSLNRAGVHCFNSSLSTVLPPVHIQKERIKKWNAYWTEERKSSVIRNLNAAGNEVGFNSDAFVKFTTLVNEEAHVLTNEDYNFIIDAFAKDLVSNKDSLYTIVSQVKVTPKNKDVVRQQLSSVDGTTLIDWKVMANNLLNVLNTDFNLLFLLTASLVLIALLLTYGRLELTLVTFIPMVVSWIWILGLMAIFNLKFNFVNIILSTFIFGLGDDFCIFVMDGLQQQNKKGKKYFSSIKMGIYLSSLTTIIGFGVLVFAQHPALRSLAFVSILGIISVLFISQTLEPYLFNFFITSQQQKGHSPLTLAIILKSTFAFSYFVFGCILLSLVGLILFPFLHFEKKRSQYLYHWLIQRFTRSLLTIMANVRKNYLNPANETFSKPALIISNHQSVLDILLLISIHPKIILLTNKWVWNSPVFGFVVRLAGYHPIVEGVETSIEKLSKAAENGYSIAVFPEGTRSLNGVIQRFHKGAFYLANELKLDIIPILIHGTGRCLLKGTFVLRDETISYKILPRISASDSSFGVTYQERNKKISRLFKNEYAIFANELETPRYYRNQLITGYLFKGPVLEWYLKVKIRLEDDYKIFNELVPRSGSIIDAGCGYGFLSHMLSFLSPERNIVGIDYDEEKIEVANSAYFKKPQVTFLAADLANHSLNPADCIIISDVLHYLNPIDRVNFLKNCIINLNPGGSIIIRDADQSKVKRHKGSKLTEIFSTQIFRFNKVQNPLSFFSSEEIIRMAEENGLSSKVIDNTKFTSNILIVLNKPK